MKLTDREKRTIEAMRAGAHVTVKFDAETDVGAQNLLAAYAPVDIIANFEIGKSFQWYTSRDDNYSFIVFVDEEVTHE